MTPQDAVPRRLAQLMVGVRHPSPKAVTLSRHDQELRFDYSGPVSPQSSAAVLRGGVPRTCFPATRSGSPGRPSIPSPIMFSLISVVPPPIVRALPSRTCPVPFDPLSEPDRLVTAPPPA